MAKGFAPFFVEVQAPPPILDMADTHATAAANGGNDALEPMKYIVVTGGVVSGLGKGVTISSIGRMLKNCGLRTTSIKIDPYLVSLSSD